MLFGDCGWAPHIHQKRAWDFFAKLKGMKILSLTTGQDRWMNPR